MAHFPCRHRFKQLIKLSGSDGGKPTVTFADQLFLQKNHRHKADRDRGDGIGQIMFHFTTPLKWEFHHVSSNSPCIASVAKVSHTLWYE